MNEMGQVLNEMMKHNIEIQARKERDEALAGVKKPLQVSKLKELVKKFNEPNTFRAGDIIQWKEGLRNKTNEGPFIVMELLGSPIIDEDAECGTAYFQEPLDLIVGLLDSPKRGEPKVLIFLHCDSRRMEPYREKGV